MPVHRQVSVVLGCINRSIRYKTLKVIVSLGTLYTCSGDGEIGALIREVRELLELKHHSVSCIKMPCFKMAMGVLIQQVSSSTPAAILKCRDADTRDGWSVVNTMQQSSLCA